MASGTDHTPAATTELPLPDGVWKVDAEHSEIGFAVKDMWGLRTVRGRFGDCHGSLNVRAPDAVGELTIDAASLDTTHHRRDQHLRSPAFFDVERHPQIVFTATALTPRQAGPTITGELTIGTSRVPLEIPINIWSALGSAETGFVGSICCQPAWFDTVARRRPRRGRTPQQRSG
jgi:polyisoprenoid-binding protein YceI